MKIENCTIKLKCDANGCHKKAVYNISFDGETYQLYLCKECLLKLKDFLNSFGGKVDENKN